MDGVLNVATATRETLSTATAMYYPLAVNKSMISSDRYAYIVIYNDTDVADPKNGDYVLSITDVKVCYDTLLTQTLPEDDINDPEIPKRSGEEEMVSFLVDENTAKAAAFFIDHEMTLPMEIGHAKINHSLALTDSIVLNYAVAKKDLAGCENVYLEVKIPVYSGNTLTGSRNLTLEPVENGDFYYFILTELTAVSMNNLLEATLYYTSEGTSYRTETDVYSVVKYAYSQLNKANASTVLRTLCADLLRYGSYAQIFKGYRTDALADEGLEESFGAYLSDPGAVTFGNTNRVLADVEDAPIVWMGKSLNLGSKVELRFIFDAKAYDGELEDLIMRVQYSDIRGNTKTVTVEDLEIYNSGYSFYSFTLDTLGASELRNVVSAQIFAGDIPVSCTLQYTADTYGNGKTGALGDLCKALFAYSDSAKAYFAK